MLNRIDIIKILINKVKKEKVSYLEIGCDKNQTFNHVEAHIKIGVDPKAGGTIRKTSDEFFLENKLKFDVVFIDGLHLYEQVIKDINNSIKFIEDGGFIVIHDMLPKNYYEQTRRRFTRVWTGDVWKAAFNLNEKYKNSFSILNTDHGVGIIKIQDRKIINNEYQKLSYSFYLNNLKNLPIINDSFEEHLRAI